MKNSEQKDECLTSSGNIANVVLADSAVVWATVPNITDTAMLAQHAYVHKDCKVPYIGDTYAGNISLCGKFSIGEDEDVSLPISSIRSEKMNEAACCKLCRRIYEKRHFG